MSEQSGGEHQPLVPDGSPMREFTLRALLVGLVMCVVLGAANAYLGLKAGMTIAATYPAAVIGMAVLRLFRGSLLEENFARTVGSIGESVAAGAIFTLPAFVILGLWKFSTDTMLSEYLLSAALMILGGTLGIMFVAILRRVMVEDRSLPFPESVAAAEIHKAGQKGTAAAVTLFQAMGVGSLIKLLARTDAGTYDGLGAFFSSNSFQLGIGRIKDGFVRMGLVKDPDPTMVGAGGMTTLFAPAATPAYIGVGYIIGPEMGALNFAGGVLAWGLLTPLLVFFLGPQLIGGYAEEAWGANAAALGVLGEQTYTWTTRSLWGGLSMDLYKYVVRPIAVGGMLVGAVYTLYRMKDKLWGGLRRSVKDLKKSAAGAGAEGAKRTERDLPFGNVLLGVGAILILMIALYFYFTDILHGAILAGVVMLVTGFFFAAVSGNLVGTIGSSNNPISGLTLATTVVAGLVMVLIGVTGETGVAAVLGVAAVVCVSSAVAGEMLQDLKAGHILGGTPWKMEAGDLIGVLLAGLVMFFPLYVLHNSDLAADALTGGFGGKNLPAPQASLMAAISWAIVGGQMAWPLVIVGILMGVALIMVKVRSPMLFAVGMYLPLETTFAIFVGGLIRWLVERRSAKRGHNEAQKGRVSNAGVLVASGLIAGEALMGLVIAAVVFFRGAGPDGQVLGFPHFAAFESFASWLAIPVFAILVAYLVLVPLRKAGRPDEAAPPPAVM